MYIYIYTYKYPYIDDLWTSSPSQNVGFFSVATDALSKAMCCYFLCALPWRGQMRPAAPFFGSGGDKAHFGWVLHTLVLHGFCTGDLSHVYHGIKQSTRGSKRMGSFNWLFWYSFWTWVLPILSHPLCWFTREVAYAAWGESALRASRSWLAQPQALRRWRCRWSSKSHLEGIEVAICSASSRIMRNLHTTLV